MTQRQTALSMLVLIAASSLVINVADEYKQRTRRRRPGVHGMCGFRAARSALKAL